MTDLKDKKDQIHRTFRPFINLWGQHSPEFNELIKTLMVLIRQGDNDKSRNTRTEPIENFKCVLSGWKRAQKIITDELIIRISRVEELEKEKKSAHSHKNYEMKQKCIRDVKRTKSEITILRRCIDSIVWTMLNNEHSSIRRLPINGNPDNLSVFNIHDSMTVADQINSDPMAIAVISDITTFVHTGDLLALIPHNGIALIELKSGKKNIEFSKAAEFSVLSECPNFDEFYTKEFNKKDLKHYQRTKRQFKRAQNVIEAIETGKGFDNFHQSLVRIHDRNFHPNFYTDKIIDLWYKIYSGKSWAITDINECLFIGAYNNSNMGFCGFNSWMNVSKISGTVFNILDSFSDALSRPFFSLNLPDKLILDIINGNLILVLCLDHKRFAERANKRYPGLYKILNFPSTIADTKNMLVVDGKGIASSIDGTVSFIANGYETRIIFDQQYPDSIIDWSYKMSDLKKDIDKKKRMVKKDAHKKIKEVRKRSRK
ncbi:hypothetical protein [Dickeya zeae]|uniref:hypothetical protein n=1 Tax=Dickeya zeae TaxID=204042 RepID=UPI001C6330D8|nr:hypothetical protein [Dickeya zeae]